MRQCTDSCSERSLLFTIYERRLLNNIAMKGLSENLVAFTLSASYLPNEEVNEQTTLENDLGITGDDVVEFVLAFGKEFKVDVSNFMLADYFGPEGTDIVGSLIRFLKRRKKLERKHLNLGHLQKAIVAGRLDEDVINSVG